MQIFAAATRCIVHKHGFDHALPIIATIHHCSVETAAEIARSVRGRQDDTISPITDAPTDD